MALPVLRAVSESTVVSFEPSPNALPWLRRTVADSGAGARWRIVESAIGRSAGTASFSVSALADGLYDGLTHTGRTGEARKVEVPVTTLDLEWKRLSQPQVSVVKIDVEGGELDVLRGGQELLARLRPFVLTEWCRLNYRAYGIRCDALLSFAHEHGYLLYAAPEMIPLTNARDMDVQAMRTDSYLMAPRELSE
jgi:FkbM family methyltransferase